MNRTHWEPIYNYAIPDWDNTEQEQRIARYMFTKTLLMEHIVKSEKTKYGCYRVLSDTRVGPVAAAVGLEEQFD